MEASKYNYQVRWEDKTLFLNGMTGSLLVLDKSSYDLFNELLENPAKRVEYPGLVEKMQKGRFLVNNNEEDLNILRAKNRQVIHADDSFLLTINPTMNCNFKCWYCYEKHQESMMDYSVSQRIKKFVHKLFIRPGFKQFSLSWFGGEPLLYFDEIVYPMSKHIIQEADDHEIMMTNSMTTNGYLFTDEMLEKCLDIRLDSLQITIDGNREMHNRVRNNHGQPSFDRILRNCIQMLTVSKEARIILRVNYTSHSILGNNYAEILSDIPDEIRPRIRVQFQRVWQTYDKEGSNQEVIKAIAENKRLLKEAGFCVSHNNQFSLYKGNVCYGDKPNYANVNYDGYIYRCTAQEYDPEKALGFIDDEGNLIWTDHEFKSLDEKPGFENELCLNCKYLPLCGGPCFSKRLYMKQNNALICPMAKSDTDIESYIIESYLNLKNKKISCNGNSTD